MLYWKAEVFDYTKEGAPCFQRLVGRGIEDSFLMFLQGLGAKAEASGLWVHNGEQHGVEVTLIQPSEYLAHRNHGLRFGDMVARMSEDEATHEYLDELVKTEIVADVFDCVYDQAGLPQSSQVLSL